MVAFWAAGSRPRSIVPPPLPRNPSMPVHRRDRDLERIAPTGFTPRPTYSIYRGTCTAHRYLLDGGGDGSLVDAYKYARDGAG